MAAVTSAAITGGLGLFQGIKGMAEKKQGKDESLTMIGKI
jgi:hypothetical protein